MTTESLPRAFPVHAAVAGTLVVWFGAVAAASMTGALGLLPPYGIAALVAAGIAIPVVGYFTNDDLKGFAERVGLKTMTALHVWRIAAALLFFWYGSQGLLPEIFVRRAAWGDMLAGVLAAVVVLARPMRMGYLLFHVIGLLDFIVAVGTGLTLTLVMTPQMQNILSFPVALIPLFGVGLSGATHVIALDLLRRQRGQSLQE